jgi:hypothetical protein
MIVSPQLMHYGALAGDKPFPDGDAILGLGQALAQYLSVESHMSASVV